MFLLNTSQNPPNTDDEDSSSSLPEAIRHQLTALGLPDNGDGVLHIQADLDARGHWSERHLIATPDRVLIFSVSSPDNGIQGVPTVNGSARLLRRFKKSAPADGNGSTRAVTIDLDVPLEAIVQAEAKNLAGAFKVLS